MKSLINFTDRLKTELEAIPLLRTVSLGDVTEVDLDKATIFPLAHVTIENGTISTATSTLQCSVMFLDVVDEAPGEAPDRYYSNSSEIYVQNNMLTAATKLSQEMLRADMFRDLFQVEEDVTVEFASERFTNMLSGVIISFSVTISNNIDLS